MKFKKRLSFSFLALFILWLLAEVSILLTGRFLLWQRRQSLEVSPGAIEIVCIGDSHTFGVGTSRQYSYPVQLEYLLNENNQDQKFKVWNLGVPGSNTREQVLELETFFKERLPHYVFWLTGRNNHPDIERWSPDQSRTQIDSFFYQLWTVRFVMHFFEKKHYDTEILSGDPIEKRRAYVNFYLAKGEAIVSQFDASIFFLSYYNSLNSDVWHYAVDNKKNLIDAQASFNELFEKERKEKYLSPDKSHMNAYGYAYYAERIYEQLFLRQEEFGLELAPMVTTKKKDSFYSGKKDLKEAVEAQMGLIEKSRGTSTYPFELVHLGHIYMEAEKYSDAYRLYREALEVSNYDNNNTIVAPFINWHLQFQGEAAAIAVCEEIFSRNPGNRIAMAYRKSLSKE